MFIGLFQKSHSRAKSDEVGAPDPDGGVQSEFANASNELSEASKVMSDPDVRENQSEIDTETTSIGAESTLQGDLDIKGQLNIYGHIEGRIRCDSEVFIGKTGWVSGDILAMDIKVAGHLEGGLECGELTILGGGKVIGEAATDTFIISEGGQFEGNSRRRTADNVTQLMRGSKKSV